MIKIVAEIKFLISCRDRGGLTSRSSCCCVSGVDDDDESGELSWSTDVSAAAGVVAPIAKIAASSLSAGAR